MAARVEGAHCSRFAIKLQLGDAHRDWRVSFLVFFVSTRLVEWIAAVGRSASDAISLVICHSDHAIGGAGCANSNHKTLWFAVVTHDATVVGDFCAPSST